MSKEFLKIGGTKIRYLVNPGCIKACSHTTELTLAMLRHNWVDPSPHEKFQPSKLTDVEVKDIWS